LNVAVMVYHFTLLVRDAHIKSAGKDNTNKSQNFRPIRASREELRVHAACGSSLLALSRKGNREGPASRRSYMNPTHYLKGLHATFCIHAVDRRNGVEAKVMISILVVGIIALFISLFYISQ
jgi:hypothetical protein